MKRIIIAATALLFCLTAGAKDFNDGWTFWYGGHPREVVRLPHDAMIHKDMRIDQRGGASLGFYTGDLFHYEKVFDVPKEWLDKHVVFKFQGVYMNSQVYINDNLAGGIHYGYSQFDVVADGLLKEGENVIRVDSDNSKGRDSRWYSGAGIYRPVELVVQDKNHIESVRVKTLSINPPVVNVKTSHINGKIKVKILRNGEVVATADGDDVDIEIPGAELWSDVTPNLYTVVATEYVKKKVTDEMSDTFGIRILEWGPDGMFVNGDPVLLKGGCIHSDNGVLGMAEYDDAADRRIRILKEFGFNAIRSAHNPCSEAILKACDKYGVYIMDELWDMWYQGKGENDYHQWWMDNYKEDIVKIVEKDYNHPSVVFYSIGNEVSEPKEPKGVEMAAELVRLLHEEDPSRPVTIGLNLAFFNPGGFRGLTGPAAPKPEEEKKEEEAKPAIGNASLEFNEAAQEGGGKIGEMVTTALIDSLTSPVLDLMDIAGYNYARARYKIEGEKHPDRVIVGSETYPPDIWSSWEMVEEYPYVVGDFMWTAWDYLGEAGAGGWLYEGDGQGFTKPYPWRYAHSGAIDVTGYPTGEAFLPRVTWEETPGNPYLAVRPVRQDPVIQRSIWRSTNSTPSWSWRGCEGIDAVVEIYSSADEVELYLNNTLLASGAPKEGVAMFHFPYEPGTITARAYDKGVFCGETSLTSATGDLSIAVKPEMPVVQKGHLLYVTVEIVGENGQKESNADAQIDLFVDGGELLGFGSGRAISEDSFVTGMHKTYYGRAQAVIYADQPGKITITAQGTDLAAQTATVICTE